MNKESAAKELMLFYPRLFRGLVIMLLTVLLGIALAVCVVYPLWSTAIHSKVAYNWFILILSAVALIFLVKGRVIPFLIGTVYFFIMAMAAVLTFIFFANGFIPGGVLSVLFILVISGIFKIYLKK